MLIFDSGVGALGVFAQVVRRVPAISCTLVLDNARFPYGILGEAALRERVLAVMGAFIGRCAPDLAVLACNTASTLVLEALRERVAIPVVGVVPAIKPAAAQSRSGVIGLLATPATAERRYTDELIAAFAPGCQIVRVGDARLVHLAERKLRGAAVDVRLLGEILRPIRAQPGLDTLVLACTHFPLLADELAALLPAHVRLLDSGAAIAERVGALLGVEPIAVSATDAATERGVGAGAVAGHRLYLTAADPDLPILLAACAARGIDSIEVLET
ncbi:MAG: glutamate racemase [Cellvibrionales bacterium]|nr:glutamate racemase [Cellvibrionales bacterium]